MSVRDNHKLLGVKLDSLVTKLGELRKHVKECERLEGKLSEELDAMSMEEPEEGSEEETTPRGEAASELLNEGGLPSLDDIEGAIGEMITLVKEERKKLNDEMWDTFFETVATS